MKKAIIFLIIVATASCTSCRVTRDLQRSNTDSTSYYRDKTQLYKDSLFWLDSVHTEMVNSWLDMGVVFAEECPPCDGNKPVLIPNSTGGPGDYTPIPNAIDEVPNKLLTSLETKADGSIILKTNQKLKALNLNFRTLASRYDSVSKASQVKDSVIKDLEQKVELVKKQKTVHVEKEWYIPWWIWLIVAGLAVLWVRKQFF